VALYRLKVIRSPDGDTAELFYVRTDELIARGTPDEVEKVLARLIREAAEEGTKHHEIAVGRGRGCEGASRPAGIRIAALRAMFDVGYFPPNTLLEPRH
jgi:hypothetical protein